MALKKTDENILKAIDLASTVAYYKATKVANLVDIGYVEMHPTATNDKGEHAVRLTEKGKEYMTQSNAAAKQKPEQEAPADTAAAETPAVTFTIVENIAPPPAAAGRGGAGRKSKYNLGDLVEGGAMFIPNEPGVKHPGKSLGSMVADFNKRNTDKYYITRTLADGAAAGFGDQHKGVAGVGIYRRPLSERPAPKPRKPRADAAPVATAAPAPAPAATPAE